MCPSQNFPRRLFPEDKTYSICQSQQIRWIRLTQCELLYFHRLEIQPRHVLRKVSFQSFFIKFMSTVNQINKQKEEVDIILQRLVKFDNEKLIILDFSCILTFSHRKDLAECCFHATPLTQNDTTSPPHCGFPITFGCTQWL